MRKYLTAVFGILTAAALTVACSQTDAGLTTKVKSRLAADDTVKAYQIDVDTDEGVVTLSGNVDTAAARDRAVAIARETEGVRDVVTNIVATGDGNAALPGEHNTAPTTGTIDRMNESAREGADRAREAGREGVGMATDASVTAAIKAKMLADSDVSGLAIDVDTREGVVTLSGRVRNATEKSEAVRIARETDGVKSVTDNLTIGQ
jgi:hyperosmotically inducible protein